MATVDDSTATIDFSCKLKARDGGKVRGQLGDVVQSTFLEKNGEIY